MSEEIKFQKLAPMPPIKLLKLLVKMGVKPPTPQVPYPENWSSLSGDEKYEFFKKFNIATEHRAFVSEEMAQTYQRRMQRWFDIVDLKEPDQVPNNYIIEGLLEENAGITKAESYYDGEKFAKTILKFAQDFQQDYAPFCIAIPGPMHETLGTSMIRWPGGGRSDALADDTKWQFIEDEYMLADEYDDLIADPENFLYRKWSPRAYKNLEGFATLPSLYTSIMPATDMLWLMPYALGPARKAIKTLLKAADENLQFILPMLVTGDKIQATMGAPTTFGSFTLAPFDIVGDSLRGTKGIMLDLYRNPDKVIAACEAVIPAALQMAVDNAMFMGSPFVFIPLHKGADGFMSNKQFEKFYWPSFKKLLVAIVDAGLVPMPFVEGSYNHRLDILADSDLPNRIIWWFDQTDMKEAKKKLGGKFTIGGNIPASMLATGTAEEVDTYCKNLVETCAPGGGFFLAPGAVIDQAKPENMHAFLRSTKKYGVY